MGSSLYFTIIAVLVASSSATNSIPLKCFLEKTNGLNVFGASPVLASPPSVTSLKFDIIKANKVNFNKDGWWHDADVVEYEGLDNAVLDEFGFNLVTDVAHVTFHTDLLVTYPYKTNGSLFSKPIYGEGDAKVFLENVQFGLTMPFDIIEKENGKKFVELKSYSNWYNVVDDAEFSFSNLYYGDKGLCDSMHKLINENWKFITTQFGKVFMDKVADNVFTVFKKYMLDIPLKNLSSC